MVTLLKFQMYRWFIFALLGLVTNAALAGGCPDCITESVLAPVSAEGEQPAPLQSEAELGSEPEELTLCCAIEDEERESDCSGSLQCCGCGCAIHSHAGFTFVVSDGVVLPSLDFTGASLFPCLSNPVRPAVPIVEIVQVASVGQRGPPLGRAPPQLS